MAILFAVACCLAAVLTSCGSTIDLSGSRGANDAGVINVRIGEIGEFTSWVTNRSNRVVVMEGVSLLSQRGYQLPQLRDVAIEPGKGFVGAGRDWPGDVSIVPFRHFRLLPGKVAQILFGISASRLGRFATHGLDVEVSAGSALVKVASASPSAICVVRSLKIRCPTSFVSKFTTTA